MISYKILENTVNFFHHLQRFDNQVYEPQVRGEYCKNIIKLFEEIIVIIEVTESKTNLPGIIYLWEESGKEIYREVPKTDDCVYNFLNIFFESPEMKNLLLKALYVDKIDNRL